MKLSGPTRSRRSALMKCRRRNAARRSAPLRSGTPGTFFVGYNEEVHGCANQEKRYHRVNKFSNQELAAVHFKGDGGEVLDHLGRRRMEALDIAATHRGAA